MLTAVVDLSKFRQKAAETTRALERDQIAATDKAAKAAREKAKQGRFKDRTGELRRGIITVSIGWSGSTYWSSIRTQASYAWYVEEDTAAHTIWPKAGYNAKKSSLHDGQTRRGRGSGPHEHVVGRGRALRWKDSTGEHFARRVNHPGTTGFHFMRDGGEAARETLLHELHSSGFVNLKSLWAA